MLSIIRTAFRNYLAGQFRKPRGIAGLFAIRAMARHNSYVTRWTIENCEILPGDTVLEIGFGHGLGLLLSAERTNTKVYGMDFSLDMVHRAAHRYKELIHAGRLELACGAVDTAPFQEGMFHKIYSVNVACFWKEPLVELREIYRMLKPGGKAVCNFSEKGSEHSYKFQQSPVFIRFTGEEFAMLMTRAGFTGVQVVRKTGKKHAGHVSCCVIGQKAR
ncbi:MAG: methyltransferase domain-containing protein [Ignavibacteria bacterium]|nr:methyltransferase domain-containing protein [Ignavibacteria bacterium]